MEFVGLSKKYVTSIGIQDKMEYLGEKMKTHVLKITRGPGPEISPRGSLTVTRIFGGETLKISKWVFDYVVS